MRFQFYKDGGYKTPFFDQKTISWENCCNKDKAYQATQHEKNPQIRPSVHKFSK